MKTHNRDNYMVFPAYNKKVVILYSCLALMDNYYQVYISAQFLIQPFHYHFSFPVVRVV